MKPTALSLALLFALAGVARAQEPVAPPAGAVPLLEASADGVQIYACEAKGQGKDQTWAWVFKGPEAALFDARGRQIGVHGAGPVWKLYDGSAVTGEKVSEAPAPAPHAVPWLLLRAKTHEGAGRLAQTAWIRRSDTRGGTAPAEGCDSAHAGETARIRYSAVYRFYR